jgi:hypothetical protein
MAANCYRTIKIHFKRGEPDIGKKQNDIVADTCFQPWLKNPAAEQGELVKNERLSEQFGSLSRC